MFMQTPANGWQTGCHKSSGVCKCLIHSVPVGSPSLNPSSATTSVSPTSSSVGIGVGIGAVKHNVLATLVMVDSEGSAVTDADADANPDAVSSAPHTIAVWGEHGRTIAALLLKMARHWPGSPTDSTILPPPPTPSMLLLMRLMLLMLLMPPFSLPIVGGVASRHTAGPRLRSCSDVGNGATTARCAYDVPPLLPSAFMFVSYT